MEYTGTIGKSYEENKYAWAYPSQMNNKTIYIDGFHFGNCLKYVNDLETHNVYSRYYRSKSGYWGVFFFTLRDIYPGEEISIDYGSGYWTYRKKNNETIEEG